MTAIYWLNYAAVNGNVTLSCGVLLSLSLSKTNTPIPCPVDRDGIVPLS